VTLSIKHQGRSHDVTHETAGRIESLRLPLYEDLFEVVGEGGDPLLRDLLMISESIPKDERKALPHDFAANLDHFLYGAPRR